MKPVIKYAFAALLLLASSLASSSTLWLARSVSGAVPEVSQELSMVLLFMAVLFILLLQLLVLRLFGVIVSILPMVQPKQCFILTL